MARDDFRLEVKQVLAQRAGMSCSQPGCRRPTSGPRLDPEKAINVGVAAHITAASAGGPRYDSSLTSRERRSASNGIWLCQTCSVLIDRDAERYTASMIREWKQAAEGDALERVESPTNAERIRLREALNELLAQLSQANEDVPFEPKTTYAVGGGIQADDLDPEPDQLRTRRTAYGITVNYMVRNKLLMVEAVYPDGRSMVADIGLDCLTVKKLPYDYSEMVVEVDPSLVLSQKRERRPDGSTLVTREGKWGMRVRTLLDSAGNLVSLNCEHAAVSIPAPFKRIVVSGPLTGR